MHREHNHWGEYVGLWHTKGFAKNVRRRREKPRANSLGHIYSEGLLRSRRAYATSTGRYVKAALAVLVALLVVASTSVATVAAGFYAVFAYASRDLPPLEAFGGPGFATTMIYDRNGELLYEVFDQNEGQRIIVKLSDVSPYLIAATLAAEDPSFFDNPGVDPRAIARAIMQNYQQQSTVSGASTITMQLVRNVLFSPEERSDRSYLRKLREAVLAYEVSHKYDKEKLLEMYINEIPYGQLAYGAEAAARAYFGKHAKDLTLGEASLLAGLPQSPTGYNPLANFDAARNRQRYVLEQMVKYDFITYDQASEAYQEELHFHPHEVELKAPHFVFFIRDLLVARYGEEMVSRGGLRVYTTLDYRMQRLGEQLVKEHMEKLREFDGHNAALVAIDPKTGEILTMVGNADYYNESIEGQVNMATSYRQPGSTMKPFTYVTAFSQGYLPASDVLDLPMRFPRGEGLPPYAPVDFDYAWRGRLSVRSGLAESRNVPAVSSLYAVGLDNMVSTARRMGVGTLDGYEKYGLSAALGGIEVRPLDITFAYSAFANGGRLVGEPVPPAEVQPGGREYQPAAILRIEDSSGKLVYEYNPPTGEQVITPEQAFLITSVLSDDKAREPTMGPNSKLNLSRPAAAKTGTTDEYWDVWTIGYTVDLVVGVDVGNVNHAAMKRIFGAQGAVPLWNKYMEAVYREVPELREKTVTAFPVPSGVQQGMVCGKADWYIRGQAPICSIGPTSSGLVR